MKLRSALRRMAWGALLGAVLLALVLYWLSSTPSGARWLVDRLAGPEAGAFEVSGLEGNLREGLTVSRLRWRLDAAQVEAEQLQIRLALQLAPLELQVRRLHAGVLTLDLAPRAAKPADDLDAAPALRMPLPLVVDEARVERLELGRAGLPLTGQPLTLAAAFRLDQRLDLHSLTLEDGRFELRMAGRLDLAAPFAGAWSGGLTVPAEWARAADLDLPGARFELHGDAAQAQLSLDSSDGRARLTLTLDDWMSAPAWQAELTAGGLLPPALAPVLGGPLENLHVRGGGVGAQYRLQGSALLPPGPAGRQQLAFTGHGGPERFQIESARLTAPGLDLQASGTVEWAEDLQAHLALQLSGWDPAPWWAGWPASARIDGAASLSWRDGALSVQELEIRTGPARLAGEGAWSAQRATARLNWQDLQWPPGPAGGRVLSRSGALAVEGRPDDWRMDGTFLLSPASGPEARLTLRGAGGLDRAELVVEQGSLLGGGFQGNWSGRWDEAFGWQAEIDAANLDLSTLQPDWPTGVGGRVHAAQDPRSGSLCIESGGVQARYHGETLTASGGVCHDAAGFSLHSVLVEAPGSRLAVNGAWGRQDDLDIAIRAERGGLLARVLGGEWEGRAALRWQAGLPRYELDLEARHVRADGWGFESLVARGQAGPDWPGAELSVDASRLASDQAEWERLGVRLLGRADGHAVSVAGSYGATSLSAELSGRLSGWTAGEQPGWAGTLDALQAVMDGEVVAKLLQARPVRISAGGVAIDQACLQLGRDGRLCGSVREASAGALDIEATAERIPLSLVDHFVDTGVRFSQEIGGSLRWSRQAGRPPDGAANLVISSGIIERPGDDLESVATGPAQFQFQLVQGQLDHGRLLLPFPGLGRMDVVFRISDLVLDGTGRVTGHVLADLDQLDLIEVFVPGIDNLAGALQVDADLGGVVANPTLAGSFFLRDARFDVPALGLEAVRLDLDGRLEPQAPMRLTGRLQSGQGGADLSGRLDFSDWDAPQIDLQVRGQDLAILNVPSLGATASPDLSVGWRPGHWSIDGRLLIPEARIEPAESVTDRVSESPDVVVVAGQLPVTPTASQANDLPVEGRLQLTLGDRVRVQMPAVHMRAAGQVGLTWRQSLLPTASGLIELNGEVRTFGPLLKVEQGRVRFQEHPLDDPVLDIRARRDIFGNTQIQSAGVRIGGTARRPEITAYTEPLTTEERAWTLLVTGSDFEYGQGVGGFDIGTYVAPRLYISYGISLFDDERTVSARYDLKRGFGIKATSSQKENGVDVSYTVER